MKRLTKLKLNSVAQGILNEQEMNILKGGGTPGVCKCCCGYEGKPGGATSPANDAANDAKGYTESYGCDKNTSITIDCGFVQVLSNWGCDCFPDDVLNCSNEPNKC